MSLADASNHAFADRAGFGFDRSTIAGIRSLPGRLLRRLDHVADRSRLLEMPDHVLRDIGLTRDGIDEALREIARNRGGSL